MVFAIRPADFERDRSAILALLVEHFAEWSLEGKFDWLYGGTRGARPTTWLLEWDGAVAGVSSAFPRRLRANGGTLNAWVLGDFCIEKDQRSLGPAIALQRTVCEAVDKGEVDLWYDFPSRTMMAIYGRMGLRPKGEMVRLVYPLRVDRWVEEKLSDGIVGVGLREFGNWVLASRDTVRRRDRCVEITRLDQPFGDAIEPGMESKGTVSLERSAEYLNWRYFEDPRGPASVLSAGRDGRTVGHLVFRWSDAQEAHIWDAFGIENAGVFRELVLEVIDEARSRGASTVTVALSSGHPLLAAFEKIGFHRRESANFYVYGRGGSEPDLPWSLMTGDRD
jgi:GNAT superfamily N-acetyltransferase